MSACLDAAMQYARSGWPVFPCKPESKEPATAHGFRDATTDMAQVERFWSRRPEMNVAVATGGNGPDVLDVDVAHGKLGYQSLHTAIRAGLVPPPIVRVATPSGGMHLYYRGDAQRNGSLPAHGLDFRGNGGYVVAPPSQVDGRTYVVVSPWNPEAGTIDFGRLKEHLAPRRESRLSQSTAGREPVTGRLAAWVATQKPGNRNQATFWAACRAAEEGDAEALEAIAAAAVSTGLAKDAVDKTIASAVRTVGVRRLMIDREAAS
jgi:Bifunctional DNA primase/polymerase, N-terminal